MSAGVVGQIDSQGLMGFLSDFVAVESLSGFEGDAGKHLAKQLEAFGFTVETDLMGNVIGKKTLGPGPTVLVDCHLDTVGVTNPESWTTSTSGELRNGRFYGRGASDMKGQTASVLFGVDAIQGLTSGTIIVAGSVAEELVEGPALVSICEAHRPDFVIIAEASGLKLCHGQRGRAEVRIAVEGVSSHSAYPTAGINAAEVMVDVITALRELPVPEHDVLGRGEIVLTDIISSPYPSLSEQPSLCTTTFDRRLVVGESMADVLGPIRAVVDRVTTQHGTSGSADIAIDDFRTYTGFRVVADNFAPAWLVDESSPLVHASVTALRSAGIEPVLATYKFCTNGSGSAGTLDIPTIGFGPGEEDQAHTVDESISLEDLTVGARGYAHLIRGLLTNNVATSPA